MANLRIAATDGWRGAVLSASSEESGLSIENTQDSRRAYVWRSADVEDSPPIDALDQTLEAIMSTEIDGLGVVFLGNTNFTTSATVSVVLKNGMTTIDTKSLSCIRANRDGTTDWVVWFDAGPIDEGAISVADPTNTDGYLQFVQGFFSSAIEVTFPHASGISLEWDEDVEHLETDSRSLRSEGTGQSRRKLGLNLALLSPSDRILLTDALLQNGQKNPVFVSAYPNFGGAQEADYQFIAKCMTNINLRHQNKLYYQQNLELREA